MKTTNWIITLMAVGIALIILSNFITPPQINKFKIKLVDEKALKLNLNETSCLYELNLTILNEGDKEENAKVEIGLVKNNKIIEVDDFYTGTIEKLETKKFQRNYTRPCNYLDGFNISFSRE